MIRPPGWDGVAFTERSQGDIREDSRARSSVSAQLGVTDQWAVVEQVHGDAVVRVSVPGLAGAADALWTTTARLPLAIFTADCFGVVLVSSDAVGVAHAGWRGVAAGVVSRLRREMTVSGHDPTRAAVGPGIGSCCFEVGSAVAEQFAGSHVSETTWGTRSVDLRSAVADQLEGLELWASGACTMHDPGWYSHRRDRAPERLASIGWLP
jgi:YfiH family protein